MISYKTINEIIKWFDDIFPYNLTITSVYSREGAGYKIWDKEDFRIVSNPNNENSIVNARFLFKNLEDKTLFDLTWK